MLTTNTQKVLSQLLDVSPKMIVSYPITGVRDEDKTIYAFIDLTKLGEDEFKEFGLIKAKEFFDLVKIAGEEADYSFDGIRTINIKSKTVSCRYVTTVVDSLESSCRTNPNKMLAMVEDAPKAMVFDISNQELSQIKSASSLFSFEDLLLESNEDGVFITTKNSSEKEGNSFKIKVNGTNIMDASILMSVSNLKKLPNGNYKVSVSKANNYAIRFESENIAGLTVIMPTKAYQK